MGEWGVEVTSIVDTSIRRLEYYIKKSKEILITANNKNTKINRTAITRKPKLEEKQLYGHVKRQTSEISHQKTWVWLRKRSLQRKTESLQIEAKNNAISINCTKAKIDKTQQNSKRR